MTEIKRDREIDKNLGKEERTRCSRMSYVRENASNRSGVLQGTGTQRRSDRRGFSQHKPCGRSVSAYLCCFPLPLLEAYRLKDEFDRPVFFALTLIL